MDSDIEFKELFLRAKENLDPRRISPFIEAGGVSAAILTDRRNIYTGVCIDTGSSLGMCAERNAIANMITNGESRILKLVCYFYDGSLGMPCGACRELLMQLDEKSSDIEILVDLEKKESVRLGELMPRWRNGKGFNEE